MSDAPEPSDPMQNLITHLEAGRRGFLDELHGLSPAQWTSKSSIDRWSILEVTEHVATVEIGVYHLLSEKLFTRLGSPEQKLQTIGKDDLVISSMRDRSRRRDAPDAVRPTGRWPTPAEAIAAFDQTRTDTIRTLEKETRDLRDYCAAHPGLKMLDGYQWVLFVIAHTERHREQIAEIKAEPGFPRPC